MQQGREVYFSHGQWSLHRHECSLAIITMRIHAQVEYNIFWNCVRIVDARSVIYVREVYLLRALGFLLHTRKISLYASSLRTQLQKKIIFLTFDLKVSWTET